MKKQEQEYKSGQNSIHSDSNKQAHANAQAQQNNPIIQTAPVPHNYLQQKQQIPLDEQQQIKQEDSSSPKKIYQIQQEYDKIKEGPIGQIEYQIKTLQKEIHEHRSEVKKQYACWEFGFDSTGDYGSIWSSVFYWRCLIKSNKKICTNDMHFMNYQDCCNVCKQKVEQLENLKKQWENMVIQQYEYLNNS